jgi:NitT/TauT family transport system substrate-binding protein
MDKAGDGFARIEAQDLPMPDRAAELAAFYSEILAVEPAAVGGKLPGPDFYGQ